MKNAIEIDHISKLYRLGTIGSGTLTRDLQRWWAGLRGREDPNSKIIQTTPVSGSTENRLEESDDYIWALKDFSLIIPQGQVLGIIGKNGAGKSTLLKILSRVTAPTSGEVRIRGRVASLLEVGTGFHPELTGRENVFLNGAILGMRREEVRRKLEGIVEFSDISKFIDTPVKRYSSGMTVRLAFSVAAHLEPEILVVDEVLAVGDASFQKKCIGKMSDVANEGRTVLFVSHNTTAVRALCNKAILINHGQLEAAGDTGEVVNRYLQQFSAVSPVREYEPKKRPGDDRVRLNSVRFLQDGSSPQGGVFDINRSASCVVEFEACRDLVNVLVGFNVYNSEGLCLFATVDWQENRIRRGTYSKEVHFPGGLFAEGVISFLVQIVFYDPDIKSVSVKDVISAEGVDDHGPSSVRGKYMGPWPGVLRPALNWSDFVWIS